MNKKLAKKIQARFRKSKKDLKKNFKNFFDWVKGADLIELIECETSKDPVRPELDNEFRTSYGRKIFEYIENCYLNNIYKINIITGKGLRSKNLDDPYQSNDLSILKYSVPNFIKNSSELMDKILKIDFDSVNSPSKGNFDIILKSKNK